MHEAANGAPRAPVWGFWSLPGAVCLGSLDFAALSARLRASLRRLPSALGLLGQTGVCPLCYRFSSASSWHYRLPLALTSW